ncbi:hypothetical protein BDV19DRAFT_175573 [Aspergillus venezuelensis]
MTSHSGSGDATSSITQRKDMTRQIQSVLSTSDCLPPSEEYYARSTSQSPKNTTQASPDSDLTRVYNVKVATLRDMDPPGFLEIIIFSRGRPVVWSNAALVIIVLVASFFCGGGPLPTRVLLDGLLVLGIIDYAVCSWYLRHKRRFTYHPHREYWGKGIIPPSSNSAPNDKDKDAKSHFLIANSSTHPSPSPSPTPWTIIKRKPTHPVVWMNAILLILTTLAFCALWHRSLLSQLLFVLGLRLGSTLDYDITMKWLQKRPYEQGSLRNWFGHGVIW